jgi:sulfatase maturation enzyme AslB (radical SAM superfamily)
VVTKLNAEAISDCVSFFANAGFDGINLIPIKDAPHLFLSQQQISAFYSAINQGLRSGRISRSFFLNENFEIFGTSAEAHASAAQGDYRYAYKCGCAVPSMSAFIDVGTGNVFPCDTTYWRPDATTHYVMGNLKQQTLTQVWSGARYVEFRKAMYPSAGYPCFRHCDPNNHLFDTKPEKAVRLPMLANMVGP